jgi:hypothetical protein
MVIGVIYYKRVEIYPHQECLKIRHQLPERFQMYLSALDLVAVMIALVVSVTLVVTTALHNARLQRAVVEYRKAWIIAKGDK